MPCPHYNQDKQTCSLNSEYHRVPLEYSEKHCTSTYSSCHIFLEHAHKELEKAGPELADRLKKLEEAQKTDSRFLRKIVGRRLSIRRLKEFDKAATELIINRRRLPPGAMDEEITI